MKTYSVTLTDDDLKTIYAAHVLAAGCGKGVLSDRLLELHDRLEGWAADTFGAKVRCLRAQAEALGAGHLVDQVDALSHDVAVRRDVGLRRYLAGGDDQEGDGR